MIACRIAFTGSTCLGLCLALTVLASSAPAEHSTIAFTSVPDIGAFADLTGQVANVTFEDYRVAVYIKVGAGWWTKPNFADPLSVIGEDGTWSADVTTGGMDDQAAEIAAFLVPAGFDPVDANGVAAIPSDVGSVALSQVRSTRSGSGAPRIRFTTVPPLNSEVNLSGAVEDAVFATHRVAVYIFAFQGWYNKPQNPPLSLTAIDGLGNWVTDVTTGGVDPCASRIAAFLVPGTFLPTAANGSADIPADVQAAALAEVQTTRARRLDFSGYEWFVKDSCEGAVGPGPSIFSSSTNNVRVDAQGQLHMKIEYRNGAWYSAEVVSERSFGYGTYRVYVESDTDALDPNVILGLFTWSNDGAFSHREIDFEAGRWGNPLDINNAQFVVQPFGDPGNLVRFPTPPGQTEATHRFTWRPDRIDFVSHEGDYQIPPATNTTLFQWAFTQTSDVPPAGGENFRMNLWQYLGHPPSGAGDVDVVISRFAYIPLDIPEPVIESAGTGPSGQFEFTFEGITQVEYPVQVSSNLATWTHLTNVIAVDSPVTVTDSWPSTTRAYRLDVPPQ